MTKRSRSFSLIRLLSGNSSPPTNRKCTKTLVKLKRVAGCWRGYSVGRRRLLPEGAEIPSPVEEIDLDKSWHGIHYLLTKTAWAGEPPLSFLVLGGAEVGDIDVGYGTARAFRSDEV